jgi:hypothetical protein
VCRNPRLAAERARKREDIMAAAEKKLEAIAELSGISCLSQWLNERSSCVKQLLIAL